MMLAPAACRRRQTAAPTRFAPPVIKTTLPCKTRPEQALLSRSNLTHMNVTPPVQRPAGLPAPSADAVKHSKALTADIANAVVAAGGWLSLADYIQMALYAPEMGYYSAGTRKLGSAGDFVTAPELTPLFGRCIARSVAPVLRVIDHARVIELGPGSGHFAA